MNLFPYILIVAFLAFCLFYYFNRKIQSRKEEQRDRLNQARQEYLEKLLEKNRQAEQTGSGKERSRTSGNLDEET